MTQSIEDIIQEMMDDPDNKKFKDLGWQPVIQVPPTARILIASQAPGKKAQESNKPFYDPSGKLLREWMGVSEEVFYESGLFGIVPMDYFFPGKAKHGDNPPRKTFADKWNHRILATMPDLELIILVGNYAMKYYLGKEMERNLTETVRNYKQYLPAYFPLVHPSPLNIGWRRRNPWFEEEIVPDLRSRVQSILKDD